MLRIRFHGRGGHGVKTASRILGTAAFLHGMQVQDSPVYGAERRGAAVCAFTRIASEPILERGVIPDPDLIIVADETLLSSSASGVLAGQELASAVFVNSAQQAGNLAEQFAIRSPVTSVDLTRMTIEELGRGSALSAALGTAACALLGFPLERVAEAVRAELADLHLSAERIERNVSLAHRVFPLVPRVAIESMKSQGRIKDQPSSSRCSFSSFLPSCVMGNVAPVISAPGNSPARHTGSWRIFRPVIDLNACTRCGICFALCPDAAISLNAQSYPAIDYDNCKGCMMCAEECPIGCIAEQQEVRAW